MSTRHVIWLLLLSLIWGSAFMMNDVVVDEVAPLTIVAGRLVIAAAMLTGVALATGRGLPPRSMWGILIVLAVTNNLLPFTLITWAQEHITSSLAATLSATMPLFTFVLAAVIGSERFDADRAAGVLIGFVGAAVLIGPDVTDFTSANTLAQFAVIAASLGYAVATIIARERLRGDPLVLASGQMLFGAVLAVPIALVVDGSTAVGVSPEAGMSWVGLGVLSSGLAYIIYFTLVQRITATNLSLVSYLIPVVATVIGWAVLDERIGVNLFVGLALIVAGMMAVNGTLRAQFGRGATSATDDLPPVSG